MERNQALLRTLIFCAVALWLQMNAAPGATFSDANWLGLDLNGQVFALASDASGNLYIGGDFTVVGEVAASRIAKWDGTNWSALGPGMDSAVYALAVLGTNVYAGGAFTNAGGEVVNHIAQWNGNSWSSLGLGTDQEWGVVYALALSGSNVYVGGDFGSVTNSDGVAVAAQRIAKWDGCRWSTLGNDPQARGPVRALAIMGSDLYVGGLFGVYGDRFIARWDGTNWSPLGTNYFGTGPLGVDDDVYALAVSGTNLYVGGAFTRAGSGEADYIARWDGSNWSPLGAGVGWLGDVQALAVVGNQVYAGGDFWSAGGFPAADIARWDGTNWYDLKGGMDYPVQALAVSGGKLYAGGAFAMAGDSMAVSLAQWDGSDWSSVGVGLNGYVAAFVISGNDLYIGGGFTRAGGAAANHIAKWNGHAWSALGSGMDGEVRALALMGGELYAAGAFTTAGGTPANYIAKWNGSSWSGLNSGLAGTVFALAVSGNNLYAGGPGVHQWNGSSWFEIASPLPWPVLALAVSGTNLYAGGAFSSIGATTSGPVALWTGSTWAGLGNGMLGIGTSPPTVYALTFVGGDLYAAGYFRRADNSGANGIASWNGSTWSALGNGFDAPVYALAVLDSEIYAGGGFAGYLSKWDGGSWSGLGSGLGYSYVGSNSSIAGVHALALLRGSLYAGGEFTEAGGRLSPYAARAIVRPGYCLPPQVDRPGPHTNTLTFVGVPNQPSILQFATNLTTSPWFPLATNQAAANGYGTAVDRAATNVQTFYRVSAP